MISLTRTHQDQPALEALRSLPELAGLDDRRRAALLPHFDHAVVPAGTRLATAGRAAAEVFIVLRGCLRTMGQGVAQEVLPGQALGWQALAAGAEWPVTVTAAVETELLVMSRAQFRAVRALS